MIVSMKKVSLVMLERDRKDALYELRKQGVIHLEKVEGKSDVLTTYKNRAATAEKSLYVLKEIKIPKNYKQISPQKVNDEQLYKDILVIHDLLNKRKKLFETITAAENELDRMSAWGDFDPEGIHFLAQKGIRLALYEMPVDKINLIATNENIKTLLVNTSKSQVRFLYIADKNINERPKGMPVEAFNVPVPEKSSNEYRKIIESSQKETENISKHLLELTSLIPFIEQYVLKLNKKIEFENIYSGMNREETGKNSSLAWLTGYVPTDMLQTLKRTASKMHWGIFAEEPAEDDYNVPTKLKNNKLVSLIYPLTDFLGTIPGYHEYDISGWFLLFFCLFFAMIFGDAGYGLLITLGALFLIIKSFKDKKNISPGFNLMLLLGLTTVIWGTITCSWFGISLKYLPEWLKNISFKPLSAVTSAQSSADSKLVTEHLEIFCFIIAIIQMSIAHLKGIIRYRKSLKCLGETGSLFMLWGMFYVVLSMVVNAEKYKFTNIYFGIPIMYVVFGLIGIGFLLSFIFSNYEGKLLASILESCKNIISVLLGVVNVFSDIISYIRLWAVGLAGAAISSTVNSMAGPLFGHAIMFVLAFVLLVFGHGLNLILDLLSVIVHGVRLNTLEFSSHLGMSWSGFKYEPFSETVKK